MVGVERIVDVHVDGGQGLIAVIVRKWFNQPGITFFTDPSQPEQFGSLQHRAGHAIPPHVHNCRERVITRTQEVLFVRSGSLGIDFYADDGRKVDHRAVGEGDAVVLLAGGHGFTAYDDVSLFYVKQGPYYGRDADKVLLQEPANGTERARAVGS